MFYTRGHAQWFVAAYVRVTEGTPAYTLTSVLHFYCILNCILYCIHIIFERAGHGSYKDISIINKVISYNILSGHGGRIGRALASRAEGREFNLWSSQTNDL